MLRALVLGREVSPDKHKHQDVGTREISGLRSPLISRLAGLAVLR